jgi:hypothetical protein
MPALGLGLGLGLGSRRAAAWTPADLLGLLDAPSSISQLRSTGNLWQNAAKSIPALSVTDPVRVVSVGAVDWVAPSDAARGLLYQESNGGWSIALDGIDDQYQSSTSMNVLYAGVRAIWTGGGSMFPSFNTLLASSGGGQYFFRSNMLSNEWRSNGPPADGVFGASIQVDGVTTLAVSPLGTYHTHDGIRASGTAAPVVIGNDQAAGGRFWQGRIAGMLLSNQSQLQADRDKARAYLNSLAM